MECSEGQSKGFKFGESGKCYLHDGTPEGIAEAKKKVTAQGLAEGGGKLEDASGELTLEYLQAFYNAVKSHPGIWSQVVKEIHITARASAGGKGKARKAGEMSELMKSENAASMEGDYIETDEYIDAPTVFAREGVFTGTNGRATKKTYEALKASVPRFLGASATPDHIKTDTLRPSDRWLGHAVNVTARDDKRDIFGYTRYYKSNLNRDELTKIKNKQYPDGSIGYFTETKDESGVFNGKPYDAVEVGPYVISEYATFFNGVKGACSREMGCGPFQNAAEIEALIAAPPSHVLVNGELKKRCPKQQNEADQMVEDEIKTKLEQTEKLLNSANEKVTSLETEMEKLKNSTLEVEALKKTVADLSEGFKIKNAAESAAVEASQKETFKKNYNAGHLTEADGDWEVVKGMNPMEYDAWKITNSGKLLTKAEEKDLAGKKQANAAGAFDLQAELAKTWGY